METFSPRDISAIPMWTEIPNYDRHVFHPIVLHSPMPSATIDDPSVEAVPLPRKRLTHTDIAELQSAFKRQSLSETDLIKKHVVRPAPKLTTITITEPMMVSEPSDNASDYDSDHYDDEISRLSLSPIPTKVEVVPPRRCHAPTPLTMMRGKSTPDMSSYLKKRDANAPPSMPPLYTSDGDAKKPKSNMRKKKHGKSTGTGGVRSRRPPPPRPDGVPGLKLDSLKRATSTEAVAGNLSPRLVSPRVQKPPTPRRPSDTPLPPFASINGPDYSKAIPTIQSPRSAFSARDVLFQRT